MITSSPTLWNTPVTVVAPADLKDSVDELWRSANGQLPTTLPACTRLFARSFFPDAMLSVVASDVEDRSSSAITMIISRQFGLRVARLPVNEWMKCGDLLVRDGIDAGDSLNSLCERILELGANIHDFNWVREGSGWTSLMESFRNRGCHVDQRVMFDVGLIDIAGDWDEYWRSRSKNHRKQMNSAWKGLGECGALQFERHRNIACPNQLNKLMDEAIAIEHGSWKGASGSSIRSRPEIEEFYRGIGGELNRRGMLELHFLRVGERAIAFEWGYQRNGVYHSHKIGYDREYARFSPGQLLLFAQLQEFFSTGDVRQVDTMGILSQATARWTTGSYRMMRYRVSSPGKLVRWALSAACRSRDAARILRDSLRGRDRKEEN